MAFYTARGCFLRGNFSHSPLAMLSHVSAKMRSADYSDHRPVCAVISPAVAQNSPNIARMR